jgi:hypothetical protein
MSIRKRHLLLLVGGMGLAVALTWAMGGILGASEATPRHGQSRVGPATRLGPPPTPVVRRADVLQRRAFSLFRKPRSADASAAPRMGGASERFGANPTLARAVDVPGQSKPAWVTPGNGALCLSVAGEHGYYSGTCSATERIIAKGLFTATLNFADDSTTVAGLVPDGVTSVEVILRDRSRVRAEVVQNVWVTTVIAPAAVDFTGGSLPGISLDRFPTPREFEARLRKEAPLPSGGP